MEGEESYLGKKSANWKPHIKKGLCVLAIAGTACGLLSANKYQCESSKSIKVGDTTITYVTEDRKWFPDKHRIEVYDKNNNLVIKHEDYWPFSKKGQLADREGKGFDTHFEY